MKLTKLEADRLKYEGDGKSRCVRWDTQVRGFGLRVYPSGHKSFILSYRFQGRKQLFTIGDYGTLTLDQARAMAKRKSVELMDGMNPLAERMREMAGETFGDLCRTYLERHATLQKKKSWEQDECRLDRIFGGIERRQTKVYRGKGKEKVKPGKSWINRKVKSIVSEDVAALHMKIGKEAPYEANRLLALLSKMFELAKKWKILEDHAPNPAHGIDRFPEVKRDRWVKPDELPRLAEAVAKEESVYIRAAIWLYLMTGVRKSELLAAKWEDVDLQRRELRLPDTKAGRVHYVPLSAPAMELLEHLPRMAGNPYLLPGHAKGRPLVNISKPWLRIRKAAGVEGRPAA